MTTRIVLMAASYLLGSVPFGMLVARSRGIDLRRTGSGNIGATNVFRSVGKAAGTLVFTLDFAKGFVPAFFFPMLVCSGDFVLHGELLGLVCGVLAVAGHNWPVWLRFRGGKGIATSAGLLAGVAPGAVGMALICWIVLFTVTRYVSVASIGAALVVPVVTWLQWNAAQAPVMPMALTVLSLLAVWKHWSNIERLRAGTENRFVFGRKSGNGNQEEHT